MQRGRGEAGIVVKNRLPYAPKSLLAISKKVWVRRSSVVRRLAVRQARVREFES